MRAILALPLLLALATPAVARGTSIELADAVPGFSDLTYADLVHAAAPGISQIEGRYEGILRMPMPMRRQCGPAPVVP